MQGKQDIVDCSCTSPHIIACGLTHLFSFDGLTNIGDVRAENCLLSQPLLLLRLSLSHLLLPRPVTPHAITRLSRS